MGYRKQIELNCSDIVEVEVTDQLTIELKTVDKNESGLNVLTVRETYALAAALLAAALLAEEAMS